MHLLITVNYKDSEYRGTVIKRGERIFTYDILAAETGLGEKQVRRAVRILKEGGIIETKRAGKGQLLRLANYCIYQDGAALRGGVRDGENAVLKAQIKENNNKELINNNIYNTPARDNLKDIFILYRENIGPLSPLVTNILCTLAEKHSKELVELAVCEAAKAGASGVRYIEGIFREWDLKGVRTADEARRKIEEHRMNSSSGARQTFAPRPYTKNSFLNYDDKEITDFDKMLMERRIARSKINEGKEENL